MSKKSTQSKVLTIRVPDSEDLKEVQRVARQLVKDEWLKAHPDIKPNQGGRPNFRDRIFSICEEIIHAFEDQGFLKDYSQEELINRVMSKLSVNKPHKKTEERHVKDWFHQLPLHYWPKTKLAQNPKALEWSTLFPIRLKIHRELYLPWVLKKMPKGKTLNELSNWKKMESWFHLHLLKQKMNKRICSPARRHPSQRPISREPPPPLQSSFLIPHPSRSPDSKTDR